MPRTCAGTSVPVGLLETAASWSSWKPGWGVAYGRPSVGGRRPELQRRRLIDYSVAAFPFSSSRIPRPL